MKRSKFELMRKLLSRMSPRLKTLDLFASIFGTISESLSVLMYLFSAFAVIDGLCKAMGTTPLTSVPYYVWAILAITFGVIKGPMRYVEQYLNHNIAFHMLAEVRHQVYGALERLAPSKLESKKSGDLLSLITSDIETLEIFYAHTISPVLIATMTLIIMFTLGTIYAGWTLSLTYLGLYILIGVVSPFVTFAVIGDRGQSFRREYSEFSSSFLEALNNTEGIILADREKQKTEEMVQRSKAMDERLLSIKRRSSVTSRISELILSIAALVFAAIAITSYIAKPDSVVAPVMAILFFPGAFRPAMALSALPSSLSNTFASTERFLDLVEEEPEVKDVEADKNIGDLNELKVSNLSFAYPDAMERQILSNVTASFPRKGIIGIKGTSGNGKSTLLKLIMRHHCINQGEISWNGEDIFKTDTAAYKKKVAMMDQDTYLFMESLRENMKEAKPDATDEEIEEAMDKASVKSLLATLPDGLDTQIDNENSNISTGEKQRLGLARILLRDPDVILLDEPTSNVDSSTEQEMLQTFKRLSNEKLIIMVSHRASTLTACDSIYSMEKGQLNAIKQA